MKLVFLHGAPASGKLTVAKALLDIVPGRLFDNHAAIDFARTMFDFGAPGFWELVDDVRVSALDGASKNGLPLVVATYCYSEPEDRESLERFEAVVQRDGGELLPVFLHCAEDEMARRVGNPDRVARRKIISIKALNRFLAQASMVPVPRANCLTLDTSITPADATAQDIVRHFGLSAAMSK